MDSVFQALITGFLLVISLTMAIGAQNAFVLRQGLLGTNVPLIVTLAVLIDAVLIGLGTFGFGSIVNAHQAVLHIVSWGGALFILIYGFIAFKRAIHPGQLDPSTAKRLSPLQAAKIFLAVSLLNPHVYLDTIVLVGGIAGRYKPQDRIWYLFGAVSASFLWFSSLGFGARLLAPIFAKPGAWRVLDLGVGLIMLMISAGIIYSML